MLALGYKELGHLTHQQVRPTCGALTLVAPIPCSTATLVGSVSSSSSLPSTFSGTQSSVPSPPCPIQSSSQGSLLQSPARPTSAQPPAPHPVVLAHTHPAPGMLRRPSDPLRPAHSAPALPSHLSLGASPAFTCVQCPVSHWLSSHLHCQHCVCICFYPASQPVSLLGLPEHMPGRGPKSGVPNGACSQHPNPSAPIPCLMPLCVLISVIFFISCLLR